MYAILGALHEVSVQVVSVCFFVFLPLSSEQDVVVSPRIVAQSRQSVVVFFMIFYVLFIVYLFFAVCSAMRCGFGRRCSASMCSTHPMPLLRISLFCPMCVLGKRPPRLRMMRMERSNMLAATMAVVANKDLSMLWGGVLLKTLF